MVSIKMNNLTGIYEVNIFLENKNARTQKSTTPKDTLYPRECVGLNENGPQEEW